MDQLWLVAPHPAMLLQPGAAGVGWQLNAAARAWGEGIGVAEREWQTLADGLLAAAKHTPTGQASVGGFEIQWVSVPWRACCLLWLTPDDVLKAAPARTPDHTTTQAPTQTFWHAPADKLELLQEFGRMGTFELDLRGGEGRWDAHMFRLFGLPVSAQPPTFEDALQSIHPEDRAGFHAEHLRFVANAGRHEMRYRLVLPDGQPRDVHALIEVQHDEQGVPLRMLGVLLDDTESSNRVREHEARSLELQKALDLAMVAVWRIDLRHLRIHYNDAGHTLTGFSRQPDGVPLGELRDMAHPDDRLTIERAFSAALASQGVVDSEARFRTASGDYLHLLTRFVAERDAGGYATGVTGISLDQTARIVERERAQALARSIELVADAAGVGVWSVEPGSGSVEWNAQMFRIHGLPRDAPVPPAEAWLVQAAHRDDRAALAALWQSVLEAGAPGFETEFRIVRPDGSTRRVVCRARRELREGQPVLLGIHLDVTDSRVTEAALQRERERLSLATRSLGMGIWERDLISDVPYWDEQMYRLRGLAPDDPRPIDELVNLCVHPDDREATLANRQKQRQPGASREHEFRIVRPDGAVRWLITVGTALCDEQGRAVRVIGINHDITERKLAEHALHDKLAAERSSRAKSEFLSRMSHELRTPLNAVLGFAQLLAHDEACTLDPQQRSRVAQIRSAGEHLLALIEDVLDLTAIEGGSLPLAQEAVAVQHVLDAVRPRIEAVSHDAGVTLQWPANGAWVWADPRRLRQVLINLLNNAVKYNRTGGQVWLQLQASTRGGRPVWQIHVRDNGRGMTADQLGHLFEPFNRLGAESAGIEGVGLGLMVVHHLVKFMGGELVVTSEPGRGSEFVVSLPAAPAGVEPHAAAVPAGLASAPALQAAAAPLPKISVLYIEDNAVNAMLVSELVALRPNVALRCAADGLSGVELALAAPPDLVLIDMQLPDIDGFEVLSRLRAQRTLAGCALVALSANVMPDDVALARSAGFDDYWTKPIDFQRFLAGIDALAMAQGASRSRTQGVTS